MPTTAVTRVRRKNYRATCCFSSEMTVLADLEKKRRKTVNHSVDIARKHNILLRIIILLHSYATTITMI